MNPFIFLTSLSVGAALLAVWVHYRAPKWCPKSTTAVILHVLLGLMGIRVAGMAFSFTDNDPERFLAIMGALTPALTYLFLAFLWMCVLLQGMLPGGRGQKTH